MPAGRPTECTPEIIAACETAARLGVPQRRLHIHAGVDRATVARWMQLGAEGRAPYAEFHDRIRAAQGAGETHALALIVRAGKENWTAAAWYLERCHGYTKEQRVEVAQAPPRPEDVAAWLAEQAAENAEEPEGAE